MISTLYYLYHIINLKRPNVLFNFMYYLHSPTTVNNKTTSMRKILTLQSEKYFPLTPATSSEAAKCIVVCAPCSGVCKIKTKCKKITKNKI